MLDSRGSRALALALTASAVAAPAAVAQPIDRAIPVPDAATQRLLAQERYYEQQSTSPVDAHHQALVDAHHGAPSGHGRQVVDLRSPDAKDAAAGRGLYAPGGTPPTTVATTRVVRVTDSGLDWGDAAIGAGTAFGLSLLAAGAVGVGRRRIRPQTS